jgi:hypothetical protein
LQEALIRLSQASRQLRVTYPQLYSLVQKGEIRACQKEGSKGLWLPLEEVKRAKIILDQSKKEEVNEKKRMARQTRFFLHAKKKLSLTNKELSAALGVREATLKSYLYGRSLCPSTILDLIKRLISC